MKKKAKDLKNQLEVKYMELEHINGVFKFYNPLIEEYNQNKRKAIEKLDNLDKE